MYRGLAGEEKSESDVYRHQEHQDLQILGLKLNKCDIIQST